jgi:hypothetical protein
VSRPKCEPRRIAESPAKSSRDCIFRRVYAELASEARVGAAHRLERFEQRPGSIEECGANHFMC